MEDKFFERIDSILTVDSYDEFMKSCIHTVIEFQDEAIADSFPCKEKVRALKVLVDYASSIQEYEKAAILQDIIKREICKI